MRISQFIRSVLVPGQLNEANETDNPAAKNTRAKAKPQGDQKRAHSKEEKKQQKPGDVKTQVSGGKGVGQEGGQVKRQVQQADKKRDRVGDAESSSETQGIMNPMRNYATGSTAEKAADRQAGAYGEFDRDRKDKTKDTVKPKWTGDRDRWSDGEFEKGPVDDMKDIEVGGKKLKYHDPAEISRLKQSPEPFDQQIAGAMEKANAEYHAAAEREKLAKSELSKAQRAQKSKPSRDSFSQSEKEMAQDALAFAKQAQGRMSSEQIRAALGKKFGLDDAGVKRLMFVMRDLHGKTMKATSAEHRDDLSDEEKEMGSARVATGGKRGSLEVKDMVRQANQQGINDMGADEIDQLAMQAKEGDKSAQEIIFKKTARMLMQAANKYSGGNDANMADMYGEAKAALMQAFKSFDPSKGASFSTWLHKVVNGLVRNASYADRNIRVPGKKADEIAKMREVQRELEQAGITGTDADYEIINRLGLKSWQDLDKLKQTASMGTSSMSTPVGDEDDGGTLGDTVGGEGGIGSEYHSSEDQAIGTGAAPDTEIDTIQKELATQDPTMSKDLMNALYDRGDVAPEAREIINSMFGIGGEEPMTDSDIGAVYGVTNYQLKKIMDTSLRGMASAIAQEQGTSPEEELQNLAKILRTRKLDYRASQMGRAYDAEDDRSPEQAADDERLAAERNAVKTGRRDFKKRNA